MNKMLSENSENSKEQLVQLIVFRSGTEEFCVPIDLVQEIIKVGHITPIPDAPAFMRGLINVRGDIVSIMDIKLRFSLSGQDTLSKHIIITKQPSGLFGLMVDEVLEVLRVNPADINTSPTVVPKIQKHFVSGIVIYEDRLIILLDLSSILSQNEFQQLSRRISSTSNSQRQENNRSLPTKRKKNN